MSKIDSALKEIKRGIAELIDEEKLISLLTNYFEKGENFYLKVGFDPTAPDLHLGHTVLLQKMAQLQQYGAIVQFLIGDFTGMIGDPSGKSETRKKLDRDTVLKNAKTYEEQVFKVLDRDKTQILFNSKWLNELGTIGLIELTSTFSVARMLEREDFEKRYRSQAPISISEFIYPLLQGYDSVALKCDIEMGGTDQKFNLLMGRQLQRTYNAGKEQVVIMVPLLEGLDGVNKMSKSLGNYIGVTEDSNIMYAKTLSISDELMWRYYELLSSKTLQEIESLKSGVQNGSLHPKKVKEELAIEITTKYYDEATAKNAKNEFDKVYSQNDLPSNIDEFDIQGPIWIAKALCDCNLSSSTSQARRDISSGAAKLNQEKIVDEQLQLQKGEYILQVGKRKFAKIRVV